MDKRLVLLKSDNSVNIIVPPVNWLEQYQIVTGSEVVITIADYLEWEQERIELPKDLVGYRQVELAQLPISRNYRNAWVDHLPTETVDIDLNRAIKAQKMLIANAAIERVDADLFGEQDFTQVKDELNELNLDGCSDLTELYNKWPNSINTRKRFREYKVHK